MREQVPTYMHKACMMHNGCVCVPSVMHNVCVCVCAKHIVFHALEGLLGELDAWLSLDGWLLDEVDA